ncbi:cytochrome c3 family protein [Acidisarcina polymorpha]|nr:cytochrome c3 family protein [Acidisarcina polymorpha]
MQGVSVDQCRLAICLLPLLFRALLPGAQAASQSATPVREADAACGRCHQSIFRSYLTTPMANASGLAGERLIPGVFLHSPSAVEYQVSSDGHSAWLSYRKPGSDGLNGREQLEYFLGSGHLGITYLYSKNQYLLESPVAYYPATDSYAMKPGLERVTRLPDALPVDSGCLRCHMSAAQPVDPGTENRYRGLPFLHTGITCESCHGDSTRHVATSGVAAVVNPIKLEAEKRDSICIACHLEGATNVQHRGRSALDYQPGQDIADYISYFAYERENTTERGVSEIEQFTSSKCKQASGSAMSCMNCHDPHRSPAPAERVDYYRAKCLTCHTAARYASTHFPDRRDCTSCHMPKTSAQNIAHVAWTDHRIRRQPGQDNLLSSFDDRPRELVPILPAGTSPRNVALAYYDLTVNGNPAEKKRALALLTAAAQASPDDPAVLQALAILAESDGDSSRATSLYRHVLKQDPDSLPSTTNLGTLLAKSGDLAAAASLWRPAFERNQDVLALGQNLATIECLLGEKSRAISVWTTVLQYSPDAPGARRKLNAIQTGQQQCIPEHPQLKLENP